MQEILIGFAQTMQVAEPSSRVARDGSFHEKDRLAIREDIALIDGFADEFGERETAGLLTLFVFLWAWGTASYRSPFFVGQGRGVVNRPAVQSPSGFIQSQRRSVFVWVGEDVRHAQTLLSHIERALMGEILNE
jgi:hypothetical protein